MEVKRNIQGGMITMVRAELAQIVSEKMGYSGKESAEIVEQLFEILKETLQSGEEIKISGFGTFRVRVKRPRKGRNPKTGEAMPIPGRKVVTFKPSPLLRKAVNIGTET
jgi:integration host factor subunit alpha